MNITVSLVVLRLPLHKSQSPKGNSDYPCTHHSSPGSSQTIPLHITVSLVVLRLALISSSHFVVPILSLSTSHSVWWYLEYPCTHHSLPGGTQTIPLLITVCLVALRLSLYSSQSTWWLRQSLYLSQSPWWYSDYPYTHHSLPSDTQTILVIITDALVVPGLSLYSSQSLWWSSVYP